MLFPKEKEVHFKSDDGIGFEPPGDGDVVDGAEERVLCSEVRSGCGGVGIEPVVIADVVDLCIRGMERP